VWWRYGNTYKDTSPQLTGAVGANAQIRRPYTEAIGTRAMEGDEREQSVEVRVWTFWVSALAGTGWRRAKEGVGVTYACRGGADRCCTWRRYNAQYWVRVGWICAECELCGVAAWRTMSRGR
jgi:hypothetical protein